MEIDVKGHSGCSIDIRSWGHQIFVFKTTKDPKYLQRLAFQARKQQAAVDMENFHFHVPKIYDILQTETETTIRMQYIYSKNFMEFFEQAGFEQVDYFINSLKQLIEYEIKKSKMQLVPASIFQSKFSEVNTKIDTNSLIKNNVSLKYLLEQCQTIFDKMQDIEIPVGLCHGDLTFSNILFNGNNYYLIDFLDSFIETPLQDIVKIRQDTQYRWSQQMYQKPFDAIRLKIICDKMDLEINSYFYHKYEWYRQNYHIIQLMNIVRILPYVNDTRIVEYLTDIIRDILTNEKKKNIISYSIDTTHSDNFTLIVPIAANKSEYEKRIPSVFRISEDGTLLCIKSIQGMDLSSFNHIYFVILKKLDERYSLKDRLLLQFKMHGLSNAEVVILDSPTSSQPETIYQTINKANITGSIFIKDPDCYLEGDVTKQNSLAIYPLESLSWVNPQDKSYVAVDDMYYVTNIIEKRIVSHYFTAGGYCFENVEQYKTYYERLKGQKGLYLSHIVYSMLLDGHIFRPITVSKYQDFE